MVRKTKAQMLAEAASAQQEADNDFEQHRYRHLMEAVAKEDADGVEFLTVRASASHTYAREMNTFHANFNDRMSRREFEDVMFNLKSEVNYMEGYVAEQEAKRQARAAALAKLSPEERSLLGV